MPQPSRSSFRHLAVLALALAGSTALAPPALAQSAGEKAAAAQALFDEAMRLVKAGQTAEACPKFEESLRLDSGMATQFRLAECYEKLGKTASAWASFVAVADAAAVAKLPDREAAARKRAVALAPRVPRLTITVPPAVAALDGIEVESSGVAVARPLWGVPVPVDPGEHVITVRAPGKKAWEGRVTASEATLSLTLAVQPLEDLPRTTATAPPPPPLPPHRARTAVPAFVLGGLAVAGLGVGTWLFVSHSSQKTDANNLSAAIKSGGGTCVPPHADPRCGALASYASDSDTLGNGSTVAFVVGGAAAVAMVTYLLLPPLPAAPATGSTLRVAPAFGAGTRGLAVTGSF